MIQHEGSTQDPERNSKIRLSLQCSHLNLSAYLRPWFKFITLFSKFTMSENIPPQQFYPDQHAIQHAQSLRGPGLATHHPLSGPHPMLPGFQESFNARAGPAGYHSQDRTGAFAGHFRNFSQDVANLSQNELRTNYSSFQNVGHHQNLPFATVLATPLPADNDNDLPPAHKILETVAHRNVKVAGARRPLSASAKGKEKLAATSQSGNGKRRTL